MKTTAVTIAFVKTGATKRSNVVVDGEQIGHFVVHKSAANDQLKWVCTHIHTGYAAVQAHTKADALNAAKKLQDLPVDWDFTDPLTVKAWPKEVMTEISIIKALLMVGELA